MLAGAVGGTASSVAKIAVAADRGVIITGHQNGRPRHPFASSPFWRRSIRTGTSSAFVRARSFCCFVSGALEKRPSSRYRATLRSFATNSHTLPFKAGLLHARDKLRYPRKSRLPQFPIESPLGKRYFAHQFRPDPLDFLRDLGWILDCLLISKKRL